MKRKLLMKLVTKHFQEAQDVNLTVPMHRVVVVDCSGSMGGELPKLRTHLKNKLASMVEPQDVMSLIWFSSKGEAGFIFQNMKISSATDLQKIHNAIDRFLVPVGLTGLKTPLEMVLKLASE